MGSGRTGDWGSGCTGDEGVAALVMGSGRTGDGEWPHW